MEDKFELKVISLQIVENLTNIDDRIFLENSWYKDIFGHTFKDDNNKMSKKGIIKITCFEKGKRTVYRLFQSGNTLSVDKNKIGLSRLSCSELGIDISKNNENLNITLEKGCKLFFYWHHPFHEIRIAFKLGFLSLGLALLSIIISLIPFFYKNC